MKNIKTFDNFLTEINTYERFPKRSFGKFTEPEEPFKRELTKQETDFMFRNFNNHSWSNVDATGKIVLGGGEEGAGMYYITEEDLEKFMKAETNSHRPGYKSPFR
jgi:hypothetical protein